MLISCNKDHQAEEPTEVDVFKNGVLIVNEGLFHMNNSNLSWVDFSTGKVNDLIFEQKTGRQLGDTGNDIGRYGGKIYIFVHVTNTIEVLDALYGKAYQINQRGGNNSSSCRTTFYQSVFLNANAIIS